MILSRLPHSDQSENSMTLMKTLSSSHMHAWQPAIAQGQRNSKFVLLPPRMPFEMLDGGGPPKGSTPQTIQRTSIWVSDAIKVTEDDLILHRWVFCC